MEIIVLLTQISFNKREYGTFANKKKSHAKNLLSNHYISKNGKEMV